VISRRPDLADGGAPRGVCRLRPPVLPHGVPMLKKILPGLAVIVIVVVVVVAVQPSVPRRADATISSPPRRRYFGQVNDFHNWEAWSRGRSSIRR